MRNLAFGLAALAFCFTAWEMTGSEAEEAAPKNPVALKAFMQGKLDASRQVLHGVVTEDYEKIALGADQMRLMSMKADWNVLATKDYVTASKSFRRMTEQLAEAAKDGDLDAATLTHVKITMSCVDCHRLVRKRAPVVE